MGDREFEEDVYDEFSDRQQRHVLKRRIPRRLVSREPKKGTVVPVANHPGRDAKPDGNGKATNSTLKRFVTFYINNFPFQPSNFFLRKGFEVCGILEEVFVANNRNRNSEVYGFVRYAKVRDVDKLLKALNNVCFGQYCVRVVLARFDRKVVREGEGVGEKKVVGEGGGAKVSEREKGLEGERIKERVMGRCEEGSKKDMGSKEGDAGEVRVGSVLVRVGGAGKKGGEGDGGKEVRVRNANIDKQAPITKLIRKYRSCEEDLNWAKHGFIGTVIDGAIYTAYSE